LLLRVTCGACMLAATASLKLHPLGRVTAWPRGDKPAPFGHEGRKDETAASRPVAWRLKKESKC